MRKKETKTEAAFRVESLLPWAFVASAVTGIGLHIAGHGADHDEWSRWAAVHIIASALFLWTGGMHIANHRAWYKSLFRKGVGKKSRITLTLSCLFLPVVVSGIVLLGVHGPNSVTGLVHGRLGVCLIVCIFIHIGKRAGRKCRRH